MRNIPLAAAVAVGTAVLVPAPAFAGTTLRASLSNAGTELNAESSGASLSADGRFVGFSSAATGAVAGDSNAVADVFVRDRSGRKTVRVSVSSSGVQGDGPSTEGHVSRGGRFVAFTSEATTLVNGDTNGVADVFLRDRDTDADGIYDEAGSVSTKRMSVASSGAQANAGASSAAVSNGRYVAFSSTASNLVPGDTNGLADVFVRERTSSRIVRISVSSTGEQMTGASVDTSISTSGRWVAFRQDSTGRSRGFIRDRDTDADGVFDEPGAVKTTAIAGPETPGLLTLAISANGRYAAYTELSGDYEGSSVLVRDLKTGKTAEMSISANGFSSTGVSSRAGISGNGRYVTFSNVDFGGRYEGEIDEYDVFVRDRDVDADGIYDESGAVKTTQASVSSQEVQANGDSFGAVMSENGKYVGFESLATNLSSYADSNGVRDIFLRTNP